MLEMGVGTLEILDQGYAEYVDVIEAGERLGGQIGIVGGSPGLAFRGLDRVQIRVRIYPYRPPTSGIVHPIGSYRNARETYPALLRRGFRT